MQHRETLQDARARQHGNAARVFWSGVIVDDTLVKELESPGEDSRSGVNLVCRPPNQVLDYISAIQEWLRVIETEQYYYPLSDTHLTLFEVCHSRSLEDAALIANAVCSNIERLIADLSAPRLHSPALTFDSRACSLNFVPVDQVQNGRRLIRERLTGLGIPASPRYAPYSAHVTFMRYIKPLQSTPQGWAGRLIDAPKPPKLDWVLSKVWVTWGATWYGIRSRISESGPYDLGALSAPAFEL
jgi:hypothetical protein